MSGVVGRLRRAWRLPLFDTPQRQGYVLGLWVSGFLGSVFAASWVPFVVTLVIWLLECGKGFKENYASTR